MEQAISLSAAKAQLAGLVHAAETGEVVHISRHGRPVAVLISEQAYAALQGHQAGRRVWTAIAQWREAGDATQPHDWPMAAGPAGEQDVQAWRDPSPGREVSLG